MSDDATTLLAHLVPKLTLQVENAATDALGYVLNKSATSREVLTDLLGEGGFDVPIVRVETQVTYEDGSRPDMAGYDENGAKRLLVESKFWASLLSGQVSGYLRQLDASGPSALLFIAPGARIETLWTEIVRQIGEASPETTLGPTTSANGWRSAMVEGVPKRLALVSWDRLLRNMADRAADDGVVAEDVRQLRGLAGRQDAEAFLPVRAEELSPDFARRAVGYNRLVDDVVDRGVSQGWMSTDGLKKTPQWYGYGRYFRSVETEKEFWFGVNHERWARNGDTPLWLRRSTDGSWFPVHVKPGVEYPEVLDDATSKVKDLAR